MNELVEYIVKSIVTKPEAVSVKEESDNGEVRLLLTVDPTDMGLVIGKAGQTIKSIRKLLTVRAMAEDVRVFLQLVEPEGYERPASEEPKESSETEEVAAESSEEKS